MKKALILAVAMVFAVSGMVFAVSPGKSLDYEGGGAGKVVFSGKTHADAGLKCTDCHAGVFQMKKGVAKVTMAEINAGKQCGTCHNGTKAFAASECAKCHKK